MLDTPLIFGHGMEKNSIRTTGEKLASSCKLTPESEASKFFPPYRCVIYYFSYKVREVRFPARFFKKRVGNRTSRTPCGKKIPTSRARNFFPIKIKKWD